MLSDGVWSKYVIGKDTEEYIPRLRRLGVLLWSDGVFSDCVIRKDFSERLSQCEVFCDVIVYFVVLVRTSEFLNLWDSGLIDYSFLMLCSLFYYRNCTFCPKVICYTFVQNFEKFYEN